MSTCKTCKHWQRYTSNFDKRYHGEHTGCCNSEKFIYKDMDQKAEKDGVAYWDYEGYSAGFETGEDFGCVHHAPFAAKESS